MTKLKALLFALTFLFTTTIVGGVAATSAQAASCAYPLPSGHSYAMNDGTPYTHSGKNATDRYNIKKIQRTVNAWSAGNARLTVDGVYGSSTAYWVKQFQRNLNYQGGGLVADGEFGGSTWRATYRLGYSNYLC